MKLLENERIILRALEPETLTCSIVGRMMPHCGNTATL